jgi:hypothetical protein
VKHAVINSVEIHKRQDDAEIEAEDEERKAVKEDVEARLDTITDEEKDGDDEQGESIGEDFCLGKPFEAHDGTQQTEGSCSTTIHGIIPSVDKMVSTLIIDPENGAVLAPDTTISITVRTNNLELAHFSNPEDKYLVRPQSVNDEGFLRGHQHVVVQQLNDDDLPLDPQVFAFFKGLDQVPDDNNDLITTIDDGLPEGEYRLCTLSGALTHQPLLMPVAQRGAQDDCIRFSVQEEVGYDDYEE